MIVARASSASVRQRRAAKMIAPDYQSETRVLIESADETGERWTTVGVSANIIDASFQALMDSIVFKLMKNRDMAGMVAAE